MEPGQPHVWHQAKHNIAFDWHIGNRETAEELFARAAHVTRLRVVNNRIIVSSMEARAALAEYDPAEDRWTLYANTQGGWLIKDVLAKSVFNLPPDKFRVLTPDVGGGFGMKIFPYPEHALVCYAARKLGRPVKWTSERSEAFLCDTQGRDNITDGEIAVDAEGKFLALRTRNLANMGAYLSTFGPAIPTVAGTGVLASVYGFKAVYANVVGVFTNTVPVDAYRGAGRPESNYLVERLIDAAARELGIDRVEIRRRNMVPPSAMPHKTPVGKEYDSGDFVRVLEAGLRNFDWAGFPARRAESRRRGMRRGIGMSYYLEATGGDPSERAEIRFADDGFVDVYVGTQSTGQGHETAYVMLTADRLGIDGEKVPRQAGRHRHHPDRRRHRRRPQPLLRGPGHPRHHRYRHREGQARRVRGARGRGRRHPLRERAVLDRRHRSRHRHHRTCGDAAEEARRRPGRDAARCRRGGGDRQAHFPEWLPHGGGRGRSRDRPRHGAALLRHRRCRQRDQPADRPRPGAWRRGAGDRPGGVRADGLRSRTRASSSPAASWTTRCRGRETFPISASTWSKSPASATRSA